MMRLQSSLVELVEAGLAQQLPLEAQWDTRPAVGVVMAASATLIPSKQDFRVRAH